MGLEHRTRRKPCSAALEPVTTGPDVEPPATSGSVAVSFRTVLHDGLGTEGCEEAILIAVDRGEDRTERLSASPRR